MRKVASYFIFLHLLEVWHDRLSQLLHLVCYHTVCQVTSSIRARKKKERQVSIITKILWPTDPLSILWRPPEGGSGELVCPVSDTSLSYMTRKTWLTHISPVHGAEFGAVKKEPPLSKYYTDAAFWISKQKMQSVLPQSGQCSLFWGLARLPGSQEHHLSWGENSAWLSASWPLMTSPVSLNPRLASLLLLWQNIQGKLL